MRHQRHGTDRIVLGTAGRHTDPLSAGRTMKTTVSAPSEIDRLDVRPFRPEDADVITRWVGSDDDLRWLAPGTVPPLTADAVRAWRKPGGHAFVLSESTSPDPIGYGELNPMRADHRHWWLGHMIVRSDKRGCGFGHAFLQALLDRAFHDLAANRISLIVFPGNHAAIACYRRSGFISVSEEYHRIGAHTPENRLLRMEIRRAAYASGGT